MYPNPIFRQASRADNIAFARDQSFGMLAVNGDDGPVLCHVPFILAEDGSKADFHLVRSNAVARALKSGPLNARLAVQGPHGYISPDWYEVEDQVPTWNYVAVQLTGKLETLPDDALRGQLDALTALHESRLLPKPEWLAAKMTPGVMERMMRQIVPVRLTVADIDGTWKLGQNKPEQVRLNAARALGAAGIGMEPRLLAALMHRPPEPDGQQQ